MSAQSIEWLNRNTRIGYTEKFGRAWHFDDSFDNHFEGAVPIEVVRELFNFPVEGIPLSVRLPDGRVIKDTSRKAIVRTDKGVWVEGKGDEGLVQTDKGLILGVHRPTYKIHQFDTWLVDTVAQILDDELQIGSAGLLRDYSVAWVQVEMPDTIVTPEGVSFRPHILCKTSHDGTLATTYGKSTTNTVCDNTMAIASSEHGGMRYRIRHTANSEARLQDARDALKIVHTMAADFEAEVASLCATTVTDKQFDQFLESLIPTPEDDGRGKTIATDKHAALRGLWREDERVAPWKNTAWGALQAMNTAQQHSFSVHGSREGSNLTKKIYGQVDNQDQAALDALTAVLA